MTKVTIRSMQKLFAVIVFGVLSAGANADAVNRCARYGVDYAPVAGSSGCVRLGGHVRVAQLHADIDRSRQAAPTLPPLSYVARDGFQPASARLAQQPLAPFELFPR